MNQMMRTDLIRSRHFQLSSLGHVASSSLPTRRGWPCLRRPRLRPAALFACFAVWADQGSLLAQQPDNPKPATPPANATTAGSPATSAPVPGKVFLRAKDAYAQERYVLAARLCWRYLSGNQPGADKYEPAQFFLAQALEKLGYIHGAVEYYFQVAHNRRTPELLPRAIRALERLSLTQAIDEALILRDLLGDTDFGDLSGDLADFVYYWQGVTNLRRGLDVWASERFDKIRRRGYYFFAALYAAAVRIIGADKASSQRQAALSFGKLFGGLELSTALDALRRRGEADSRLAYSLKALVDEDNRIRLLANRLPKGWQLELALLALARLEAEAGALLKRTKETDEEELGKPFAYAVSIGGLPVYRRAPRFEERIPAIKAVAKRIAAVRKLRGKALHTLARLLYEQKRFAAAYETLGRVPAGTQLGSEILLERAWSKYKAGDPHRAMGLLYALDAPVFRHTFLPEKYILRGLIYRRFCHFRAAKIAARGFRRKYAATLRLIRGGKSLLKVRRVRQAAARRVPSRPLFLFYRQLRREYFALRDDDRLKSRRLRSSLRGLYKAKLRQTRAELERAMKTSTAEVAEEMLRAEEQVNLLEYEVAQAIFQRVDDSEGAAKIRKPAPKVPLSSERVYYRFEGEYWTEELPSYKFNIEDRCVS